MIRVSMPGAKVAWPFAPKADNTCGHPDTRRTLVQGLWLCRRCKDRHDHPERYMADLPPTELKSAARDLLDDLLR